MDLNAFKEANKERINQLTEIVTRQTERGPEYDICLKTQVNHWKLQGWTVLKQTTPPKALTTQETGEEKKPRRRRSKNTQ